MDKEQKTVGALLAREKQREEVLHALMQSDWTSHSSAEDFVEFVLSQTAEKDAEIERLTVKLAAAEKENTKLVDVLRAWQGWFDGPYREGVSYINPPLTKTAEVLKEITGESQ